MSNDWGVPQGYRFGFQGQEADNEVYGAENAVSYKYRVQDPRLGRFLSIDPLAAKYPQWSPYVFSGNQVIHTFELEGLEPWRDANKYAEQLESRKGHDYGYDLGISVDITAESSSGGSSGAELAGLPAAAATNRVRMEVIRGGAQQIVRQGSRHALRAFGIGLGTFMTIIYGGSLNPNPGPADPGYVPFGQQQSEDDPQEGDDEKVTVYTTTDGPLDLDRSPLGPVGSASSFGGTYVTEKDITNPIAYAQHVGSTIPWSAFRDSDYYPEYLTRLVVPKSSLFPDPSDPSAPIGNHWLPPGAPAAITKVYRVTTAEDGVTPIITPITP